MENEDFGTTDSLLEEIGFDDTSNDEEDSLDNDTEKDLDDDTPDYESDYDDDRAN